MFFDTHAHLDDEQYQDDLPQVIARAAEAGVGLIVNAGCNLRSTRRTLELVREYDFIYGAVGFHPHDAKDCDDAALKEIMAIAQNPKIVAWGEIGLDYYWNYSPPETQKEVFRRQIAAAREMKLPIIVHDRDAHQDVFDIVKAEKAAEVGGVFHCYSGSPPLAREIVKLGFYLAVGGTVTFHNARKVREVVAEIALDKLLIETDCPYLAPVPYRGKRNEPAYVVKTAEMIAEIKGLTTEEVARVTAENGKRLFGI